MMVKSKQGLVLGLYLCLCGLPKDCLPLDEITISMIAMVYENKKDLMLVFSITTTLDYTTSLIVPLYSALWNFTLTARLRYENASSEANLKDRYAKMSQHRQF